MTAKFEVWLVKDSFGEVVRVTADRYYLVDKPSSVRVVAFEIKGKRIAAFKNPEWYRLEGYTGTMSAYISEPEKT